MKRRWRIGTDTTIVIRQLRDIVVVFDDSPVQFHDIGILRGYDEHGRMKTDEGTDIRPELVGRPVNAHNEVSTRTFFARFAVEFALIAACAAAFAFALALTIEFALALAFTRQHCNVCETRPPISTSIEYLLQSGRVDSSASIIRA